MQQPIPLLEQTFLTIMNSHGELLKNKKKSKKGKEEEDGNKKRIRKKSRKNEELTTLTLTLDEKISAIENKILEVVWQEKVSTFVNLYCNDLLPSARRKNILKIISWASCIALSSWANGHRNSSSETSKIECKKNIRQLFTRLAKIPVTSRPNINFSGLDLSKINLKTLDLRHYIFENTDFSEADLSGANLTKSNITNAVFKNTTAKYLIYQTDNESIEKQFENLDCKLLFKQVSIYNLIFNGEDIEDCNFSGFSFYSPGYAARNDFRGAMFKNCIFLESDLQQLNLRGAKFENCQFIHCNITNSCLTQTSFIKCDFSFCDFSRSNLREIYFSQCTFSILTCFNLQNISLETVDFFKTGATKNVEKKIIEDLKPGVTFDKNDFNNQVQKSYPHIIKFYYAFSFTPPHSDKTLTISFEQETIENIDFANWQLSSAILDLSNKKIKNCNFANFQGIILFKNSKIINCNFNNANIDSSSDFSYSTIKNSSFCNSTLDGIFKDSTIYADVDFEDSIINAFTIPLTDKQFISTNKIMVNNLRALLQRGIKPKFESLLSYLARTEEVFDNVSLNIFTKEELQQIVVKLKAEGKNKGLKGSILDRNSFNILKSSLTARKTKNASSKTTAEQKKHSQKASFKSFFEYTNLQQVFGKTPEYKETKKEKQLPVVDLSGMNIKHTNCQGVYVGNCSLVNADARYADFSNADFSDITKESIEGCNVDKADFSNVNWGENQKGLWILIQFAVNTTEISHNTANHTQELKFELSNGGTAYGLANDQFQNPPPQVNTLTWPIFWNQAAPPAPLLNFMGMENSGPAPAPMAMEIEPTQQVPTMSQSDSVFEILQEILASAKEEESKDNSTDVLAPK